MQHLINKNHILCSCVICHKQLTVQSIASHHQKHIRNLKLCPVCHNSHDKSGVYCSRRCANSRPQSASTREAKSARLKGRTSSRLGVKRVVYTPITYCTVCKSAIPYITSKRKPKTCSPKCKAVTLSNAGKKSASIRITRSADEIALYTLCNDHYMLVSHNTPMFNGWDADIIIHDTKTAILWNGPWHYKEMPGLTHSLVQVSNRDAIKIHEIEKAGWKVISFNDNEWTPATAFAFILHQDGVSIKNWSSYRDSNPTRLDGNQK